MIMEESFLVQIFDSLLVLAERCISNTVTLEEHSIDMKPSYHLSNVTMRATASYY